MVELIADFLENLAGWLWGLPTVIVLIGSGLFFTIALGGIQLRGFKHALDVVRGRYDHPDDPGEINHFRALCTAISGTVGLGNIAGVAVAIKLGGPGATFWMIVAGLVGMATKYVECSLAVMYRDVDEQGVVHGGPMHYIQNGLGAAYRPLAIMFAVCCVFAAIGVGNMFQVNQVAASLATSFDIPPLTTGLVFMALTAVVLIGGIKRIGVVAGTLVPFMALAYLLVCSLVVISEIHRVPAIISEILTGAFCGTAAIGGFTGAALRTVMLQGIRRAAFSNEAGLGSAAIAHAAAKTKEKVREGLVALLEPFVDTVIICTLTALVINITGVWQGDAEGVALTMAALNTAFPGLGTWFIPMAVTLFAFSTMISWSYYGERSIVFLCGPAGILPYRVLFCAAAIVAALWELDPILNFSDSMAALMIIPNLIALWLLFPKVKEATNDYFARLRA